MDKSKHESDSERSFPIEFVSPYSLEECVARLPKEFLYEIDQDYFELKIMARDTLSSINIYGYLQRYDKNATLVKARAKIPLYEHLWPFPIFIFVFLMSQILFASPYPTQIALLVVALIGIYVLRGSKSAAYQRAQKVLSILQSVPKRKVGENTFPNLFFPFAFEYRSSFSPEFCRVRFQRALFNGRRLRQPTYSIELAALSENSYEFHITSSFGSLEPQTHVIGRLEPIGSSGTQVSGKIGNTIQTVVHWSSPIWFMPGLLALSYLVYPNDFAIFAIKFFGFGGLIIGTPGIIYSSMRSRGRLKKLIEDSVRPVHPPNQRLGEKLKSSDR